MTVRGANYERRPLDLYEMPPEAVRALLSVWRPYKIPSAALLELFFGQETKTLYLPLSPDCNLTFPFHKYEVDA